MDSNVRWKWRFGISIVADSWFVCKFEWMSSMSPLRYFVVTWLIISSELTSLFVGTYSFILLIKVVDVAIEDLNKEFD
jgi:hypothetical protein